MTRDPFRDTVDDRTSYTEISSQFYEERLARDGISTADWPSQVDRAALDLLHGVAIGHTDSSFDIGGTIGPNNFGRATGEYYVDGLETIAGQRSDLPELVDEHDDGAIGDFVYSLTEIRHKLRQDRSETDRGITDIDRAIEAIVDKIATRGSAPETGQQPLQDPEAVVDIVHQLFSDPASSEYADHILDEVENLKRETAHADLLEYLDRPQMVTPLWDHQRSALAEWCDAGKLGYVDMATATGKTVLGLAAIAHLFGDLHPHDKERLPNESSAKGNARVLVVAGQDLLLEQWQSEFDEHLNIPRDRTRAEDRSIDLSWGTIEFRTAQDLLANDPLGAYDLVILDEAHRYRSGTRETRGWRDLFEELVDRSSSVLAMSGSIDEEWLGDEAAKTALEENLERCKTFSIREARERNVIANFSWQIAYASSDDDEALRGVEESTETLASIYSSDDHKFRPHEYGEVPDSVNETFETLRDLRSFAQSNEGAEARDRSTAFDRVATAAFSRRPKRWQLSPPDETVRELIDDHVRGEKCVVLVQSYEQASRIGETLQDAFGEDIVCVADKGTDTQRDQIETFNAKDRGVIVGPGNVIGIGVDMPDASVAINLAKGGVNASLIQRIGRVLRNPDGDDEARFYQVVPLPRNEKARLDGEDGRRLLQRAAEFRALGARFRELPGFTTVGDDSGTAEVLASLEEAGMRATVADHRSAEEMIDDEVGQDCLRTLIELIRSSDTEAIGEPVLTASWTSETVKAGAEPVRAAVDQSAGSDSAGDDPPVSEAGTETDTGRKETGNATESDDSAVNRPSDSAGGSDRTQSRDFDVRRREYDDFDVTVTGDSGDRISNVSVRIADGEWSSEAETDASGVAAFEVPSDVRKLDLTLDHPGHETKEIERYRRETGKRSSAEFSLPSHENRDKPDARITDPETPGTVRDGLSDDTDPETTGDATSGATSGPTGHRSEPERSGSQATNADGIGRESDRGPGSGPTPRDLRDELHRLADEFGHPPRPSDADAYGRYPTERYREEFGPWDRTLDTVDMNIDDAWGNPSDYDDELLAAYAELRERLGHVPSERNVDEIGRFDAATYTNRWESLSEVEALRSETE